MIKKKTCQFQLHYTVHSLISDTVGHPSNDRISEGYWEYYRNVPAFVQYMRLVLPDVTLLQMPSRFLELLEKSAFDEWYSKLNYARYVKSWIFQRIVIDSILISAGRKMSSHCFHPKLQPNYGRSYAFVLHNVFLWMNKSNCEAYSSL